MRQTAKALLTVSLPALFMIGACSNSASRQAKSEAPPPVYQSTPESAKPLTPSVAIGPKLPEVQSKIKTVFKDAAVLHPSHNPNFFSGDFNGDNSQDLVVILKPVNLDEMNRQFAPWLVLDPRSHLSTWIPPTEVKDVPMKAMVADFATNHWLLAYSRDS